MWPTVYPRIGRVDRGGACQPPLPLFVSREKKNRNSGAALRHRRDAGVHSPARATLSDCLEYGTCSNGLLSIDMSAHTSTNMPAHMSIHMSTHMPIHMPIHTSADMSAHVCTHVYTRVYTCVYTRMREDMHMCVLPHCGTCRKSPSLPSGACLPTRLPTCLFTCLPTCLCTCAHTCL